jgi:hypothetical protein
MSQLHRYDLLQLQDPFLLSQDGNIVTADFIYISLK